MFNIIIIGAILFIYELVHGVEKGAGGCWWVETHGWGRKRVLAGPKRAMVC